MKDVLLSTGMLFVVLYVGLVVSVACLVLVIQRRFFLHPDEDQSFTLPGIAAVGTGMLFLWQVFTSGV